MNLAVEILFVLLVAADTVLTYKIIQARKGSEKGFARHYICSVPLTVAITVVGAGWILLLANIGRFYIPLYVVTAIWAWVVWRNWRIWRG